MMMMMMITRLKIISKYSIAEQHSTIKYNNNNSNNNNNNNGSIYVG
jgi:hypothetical protein